MLAVSVVSGQAPAAPPVSQAADAATQRAIVNQYCVTCHNQRLKTANLLLDQVDLAALGDHPDLGEKIVRKLRAGMMPPPARAAPTPPQWSRSFAAWRRRSIAARC